MRRTGSNTGAAKRRPELRERVILPTVGDRGRHFAGLALCALLAATLACGAEPPPRRVISLSESTTHVAEALGLGEHLQSLDPRG